MTSSEADLVCVGSNLGFVFVPKSFQNRSPIELQPLKIEFGKPFWFQASPGSVPCVPGETWGCPGPLFGMVFGLPNPSKIGEKSTSKNDSFSDTFFKGF